MSERKVKGEICKSNEGTLLFLKMLFFVHPVNRPAHNADSSAWYCSGDGAFCLVVGDTRGNDNGVNTAILNEIVEATIDENADFIMIAGDPVNGSSSQSELEWQTFRPSASLLSCCLR